MKDFIKFTSSYVETKRTSINREQLKEYIESMNTDYHLTLFLEDILNTIDQQDAIENQ